MYVCVILKRKTFVCHKKKKSQNIFLAAEFVLLIPQKPADVEICLLVDGS